MATRLDQILDRTRQHVAECKQRIPVRTLEAAAEQHMPRGFADGLRTHAREGPAVIAELKKASPSKGLIRERFDAALLAPQMEVGGAAALSVLTDEPFFQGSLTNLEAASCTTSLPCLRKDFIVDTYQIVEARAHRADAILLIAAALSDGELRAFTDVAHALALDVLCEVHTREEVDRIADLGCAMVGVNNRDLRTFEVRLDISVELAPHLPRAALHVAESGIRTPEDYARLHNAGFQAFLIGESFMRQQDPGAALAVWLRDCAALSSA
jgi:indole-3-glycerol phosphate synthase